LYVESLKTKTVLQAD